LTHKQTNLRDFPVAFVPVTTKDLSYQSRLIAQT